MKSEKTKSGKREELDAVPRANGSVRITGTKTDSYLPENLGKTIKEQVLEELDDHFFGDERRRPFNKKVILKAIDLTEQLVREECEKIHKEHEDFIYSQLYKDLEQARASERKKIKELLENKITEFEKGLELSKLDGKKIQIIRAEANLVLLKDLLENLKKESEKK